MVVVCVGLAKCGSKTEFQEAVQVETVKHVVMLSLGE